MKEKFRPIMDQKRLRVPVNGTIIEGETLCVPVGIANTLEDENLELSDIILGLQDLAESELGISKKRSLGFVLDGNDLGLARRLFESKGFRAHVFENLPDRYALNTLPFQWHKMLIAGYKAGSQFYGHCVAWKRSKTPNRDPHQGVLFDPIGPEPEFFHLSGLEDVSKMGFVIVKEIT